MLIKGLLTIVTNLIIGIFSILHIPALPDAFMHATDALDTAIVSGLSFVWLIIDQQLVLGLLPIVFVMHEFDHVYGLVMWILRKIPFLNFN